MHSWHFHLPGPRGCAGLLAGDTNWGGRTASATNWTVGKAGWSVTRDRPPPPDLRVLLGFAALVTALVALALPGRGAQSEISIELYLYPLNAPPARASEVAGFLAPERATALGKQLLSAQPLLASTVVFVLPDVAVVDAPIACTPLPGARLGATRARVIIQLDQREISLSGSVIMHPEDSPIPFLRSFSATFARNTDYTYCIRGMFFIVSDQLVEGIVLIHAGAATGERPPSKRVIPRLLLEPSPVTDYSVAEFPH